MAHSKFLERFSRQSMLMRAESYIEQDRRTQNKRKSLLNIERSLATALSKESIDQDQIADKVNQLIEVIITHANSYQHSLSNTEDEENKPSKKAGRANINPQSEFEKQLTELFIDNKSTNLDTETNKYQAIQKLNSIFKTYLHCLDALIVLLNYKDELNSLLTQNEKYGEVKSFIDFLKTDNFMKFCSNHHQILDQAITNSMANDFQEYFKMLRFYLAKMTDFFILPCERLLTKMPPTSDSSPEEKNMRAIPIKTIDDFYSSFLASVQKQREMISTLPEQSSVNASNIEESIKSTTSILQIFSKAQKEIQAILENNRVNNQKILPERLLLSTHITLNYTSHHLEELLQTTYHLYEKLLENLIQIANLSKDKNKLNNNIRKKLVNLFTDAFQFLNKKNDFFFFENSINELLNLFRLEVKNLNKMLANENELKDKTTILCETIDSFLNPPKKEKVIPQSNRKPPKKNEENYTTPPELTQAEMAADQGPKIIAADDLEPQIRTHIDNYLVNIKDYLNAMKAQSRFINIILNPANQPSFRKINPIIAQSNTLNKEKKKFENTTFPMALELKPNDPKRIELYEALSNLDEIGRNLYSLNNEFNSKLPEIKNKIQENIKKKREDRKNTESENPLPTPTHQSEIDSSTKNNQRPKITLEQLIKKAEEATKDQQPILFKQEIKTFIASTRKNKFTQAQIPLPKHIQYGFNCLLQYINQKVPGAQVKLVGSTIESLIDQTKTKKSRDIDFQIIIDPGQAIKNPEDGWFAKKTIEITEYIVKNKLFPGYLCGPAEHISGLVMLTKPDKKIDVQVIFKKYHPALTIHELAIDIEGNIIGSEQAKKDLADKMLRPIDNINIAEAMQSDIKFVFNLLKKHLEGYQYDTEIKKALNNLVIHEEINQAAAADKIKHLYREFGDDFIKELIELELDRKLLTTFSNYEVSKKATLTEKINFIKEQFKTLGWIEEKMTNKYSVSNAGLYGQHSKASSNPYHPAGEQITSNPNRH